MIGRAFRNTKKRFRRVKINSRRSAGVSWALLCSLVIFAASVQCTNYADQCRKEKDNANLCSLVALDVARQCASTAAASGQSSQSCYSPLLGAALLCPLTVSDACE